MRTLCLFSTLVAWNFGCSTLVAQAIKEVEVSNKELLYLVRVLSSESEINNQLELVPSQLQRLKKIAADAIAIDRELRNQSVANFQKLKTAEKLEGEEYDRAYRAAFTGLQEKQNRNADAAMKEINGILVPAQIKALRQCGFRSRFNATGAPFRILRIAYQQVGMETKQLMQANRELDKIQEKYSEELKRLRKKTMNQIMQSLDKEQAAKVLELTGKQIFPPVR